MGNDKKYLEKENAITKDVRCWFRALGADVWQCLCQWPWWVVASQPASLFADLFEVTKCSVQWEIYRGSQWGLYCLPAADWSPPCSTLTRASVMRLAGEIVKLLGVNEIMDC